MPFSIITTIKFTTTILQFGNNTGIEVTEQQLEQLGGGKKPLVVVSLNGYQYQSAVGKMGNQFLISLSAQHRKAANVKGGDTLDISVELDADPRTVDVPAGLQDALDKNEVAKAVFEKLAPSKKKALVLSVTEAKSEETRDRRIEKAIQSLVTA